MNGEHEFYADNNPVNGLIASIGAMCEMAGVMRENLIKNGFSREEALNLVNNFLIETFKASGK